MSDWDRILGLDLSRELPEPLPAVVTDDERIAIERLFEARGAAREAKDWAEADRLRGELGELSVIVVDTPEGSLWKKI